MRTGLIAAGASLVLFSANLSAQVPGAPPPPVPGARPGISPQRADLEQRIRQRTAQIVQRRLQLKDDQMTRLKTVNQQFDIQRRQLMTEERQARQALRAELMAGDQANQQKVSALLDQLLKLQHRRLDLVESEQGELAKFMTPVQRAKYFALQAELRNRVMALRDRAARGRPGMPPGFPGRPGMIPGDRLLRGGRILR
jgi:Spy/CpxP family protein refolding chaperone